MVQNELKNLEIESSRMEEYEEMLILLYIFLNI